MKFEKLLELLKNESNLIDEWSGTLLGGGGKRLESSPQRGEEAIISERLASVTSAGEGDLDVKISKSIDVKSVTGKINCHALLSEREVVSSIQSPPSPEFLNSLPFIKKFFPAPRWGEGKFTKVSHNNSCNSRHSEAHSQSAEWLQKTRRSARLFCNYVGTFNANEKIYSRKNPANVNSIKLQGETMNNLTKTNNTSIPNISGIG